VVVVGVVAVGGTSGKCWVVEVCGLTCKLGCWGLTLGYRSSINTNDERLFLEGKQSRNKVQE